MKNDDTGYKSKTKKKPMSKKYYRKKPQGPRKLKSKTKRVSK